MAALHSLSNLNKSFSNVVVTVDLKQIMRLENSQLSIPLFYLKTQRQKCAYIKKAQKGGFKYFCEKPWTDKT